MTCDQVRRALSRDGGEAALDAHLATCSACAAWAEALGAVRRTARALVPAPPAGLADRVVHGVLGGAGGPSTRTGSDPGSPGGRAPATILEVAPTPPPAREATSVRVMPQVWRRLTAGFAAAAVLIAAVAVLLSREQLGTTDPRLELASAVASLEEPGATYRFRVEGEAEAVLEAADLPAVPDLPDVPPLPDLSTVPDLPPLPELPALPDLPPLPQLPALPTLPALPDMPDLPGMPGGQGEPGAAPQPASPAPPPAPALPAPDATAGADVRVDLDVAALQARCDGLADEQVTLACLAHTEAALARHRAQLAVQLQGEADAAGGTAPPELEARLEQVRTAHAAVQADLWARLGADVGRLQADLDAYRARFEAIVARHPKQAMQHVARVHAELWGLRGELSRLPAAVYDAAAGIVPPRVRIAYTGGGSVEAGVGSRTQVAYQAAEPVQVASEIQVIRRPDRTYVRIPGRTWLELDAGARFRLSALNRSADLADVLRRIAAHEGDVQRLGPGTLGGVSVEHLRVVTGADSAIDVYVGADDGRPHRIDVRDVEASGDADVRAVVRSTVRFSLADFGTVVVSEAPSASVPVRDAPHEVLPRFGLEMDTRARADAG